MTDCPKCQGRMTPGHAFVPDTGSRVKWMDGEAPNIWRALAASVGIGQKPSDFVGRRCSYCGYVEFFTDPTAKPIKTLSSVDEETQQLRSLMARMQDRLAVLETIATDPGERISREIEALRREPDDGAPK